MASTFHIQYSFPKVLQLQPGQLVFCVIFTNPGFYYLSSNIHLPPCHPHLFSLVFNIILYLLLLCNYHIWCVQLSSKLCFPAYLVSFSQVCDRLHTVSKTCNIHSYFLTSRVQQIIVLTWKQKAQWQCSESLVVFPSLVWVWFPWLLNRNFHTLKLRGDMPGIGSGPRKCSPPVVNTTV